MACAELLSQRRPAHYGQVFDHARFTNLRCSVQQLIASWFKRAADGMNAPQDEKFEPFIYAWIALNGWAVAVTEEPDDRNWLDVLRLRNEFQEAFAELIERDASFREAAEAFRNLWPVVDLKSVLRLRSRRAGGDARVAPCCMPRHRLAGEPLPLDWPHTLSAIYQVRCNLFHGGKHPEDDRDRALVGNALVLLVQFLQKGEFFSGYPWFA